MNTRFFSMRSIATLAVIIVALFLAFWQFVFAVSSPTNLEVFHKFNNSLADEKGGNLFVLVEHMLFPGTLVYQTVGTEPVGLVTSDGDGNIGLEKDFNSAIFADDWEIAFAFRVDEFVPENQLILSLGDASPLTGGNLLIEFSVRETNSFEVFLTNPADLLGPKLNLDAGVALETGLYFVRLKHNSDTGLYSLYLNDMTVPADTNSFESPVSYNTIDYALMIIGGGSLGGPVGLNGAVGNLGFYSSMQTDEYFEEVYNLGDIQSLEIIFELAGSGTPEDPYQIETCQQLQDINQDLDAHYMLMNDIDCTESATWNVNLDEWVDGDTDNDLIPDPYTGVVNNGYFGFNPIGMEESFNDGFTGSLDGQGYEISNLWIFRKGDTYVGLFGFATGATIQNVVLEQPQIVGGPRTGGILGSGTGVTLSNVVNSFGMVRAYLSQYGGGIAGLLYGASTLESATVNEGNVHGSGNIIGGLVGDLNENSSVIDSTTSADVDGGEYIGGAFGQIVDSAVDNVSATGDVVSNDSENEYINIVKSGDYTGGFAGLISNSDIQNSYATGSVTAEGNYTGGFSGSISSSDLVNVYATGDVTALGNTVGGFAGQFLCGSTIGNAYALGNVDALDGSDVGGFTGFDGCEGPGAYYEQVSAHGDVVGNNNVGGFVGISYVSDFTDVYASGDVTGNDTVGGFGGYVYYAKIDNAYSRGSVTGSGVNDGSFIGINYIGNDDRIITNSFYDSETSNQLVACSDGDCSEVTQKTTLEMQTQSTFTDAGWDFDEIWVIDENNDGYPRFIWEESFRESEFQTMTVVADTATDIGQTTATLRATVTEGDVNGFGFFWGTESYNDEEIPEPSENAFFELSELYGANNGDTSGDYMESPFFYETSASDLLCGTTYYARPLVYRAVQNEGYSIVGLGIGNEISFTTLDCGDEDPAPTPRRSSGGMASPAFFARLGLAVNTESNQSQIQTLLAKVAELQKILAQLQGQSTVSVLPTTPQPVLRIGSTGESVLLLQRWLGVQPQSGRFINITDTAVKAFQRQHGLQPDGIVGPATWAKLFAVFGSN